MRCPTEFADLLTRDGRALLDGRSRFAGVLKTGQRFVSSLRWIDADRAMRVLRVLEDQLLSVLTPMSSPIPPEALWGMRENYAELLPKTVRARTVTLASRSRGHRAAERAGILRLLTSDTFGRFAEVLSGRQVRPRWGTQLLCYGPGDYAGPHNDHHPEDPEARDGYTDVHLTFSTGVAQQLLVYEAQGHFTEQVEVGSSGCVTAYRLPFWHYTTPLRPLQRATAARRWVLLGTFLDRSAPRP